MEERERSRLTHNNKIHSEGSNNDSDYVYKGRALKDFIASEGTISSKSTAIMRRFNNLAT